MTMEVFLGILIGLGILVGIPALIGLLLTGTVGWYNKHKTAQAKSGLGNGTGFLDEVCGMLGGDGICNCIQCGTCTGSCPNANEMEYSPRRMIAMVRAGMRKEVISSDSMWYCASCYLCTERCPQGVPVTHLMYSLRQLAFRNGFSYGPTGEPIMNRAFVDIIDRNGRVHEVSLMLTYYMQSSPLAVLKMAPIGLKMLLRGRMPLRPDTIKDRQQLTAIITKARALETARAAVEVAS